MKKLLMLVMFVVGLVSESQAEVVACDTSGLYNYDMQQAAANQQKANAIVVRDTSSQQLQTYYSQLATYWNQLAKDVQQKQKDDQQIAKDIQQKAKDAQQLASDKALTLREVEMQNLASQGYDECDAFVQAILPLLGACDVQLKEDLKRIHTNRSGGGDLTNPGGGGNLRGFDNPHKVH